jgi:hypothetical protein
LARFLEHTFGAEVVSYVNRRSLWRAEDEEFSLDVTVASYMVGDVDTGF